MKIKLETIKCDYCGSEKFTKLFSGSDLVNNLPGVFDVVRCLKCGLVCTNPRPSKKQIKFYYPETTPYFQHKKIVKKTGLRKIIYYLTLDLYFNYKFYLKNIIINRVFGIILFPCLFYPRYALKSYGIPNWVPNGRLLEVGCSWGNFLTEMKELGWTIKGIDVSRKSVQYGKTKLRLDLFCGDFDKYQTSSKYDVITMRMFLEHCFSPNKVLEKAKNMLKENGQLIIIVPDFSGFEAQIYKEFAYTLQLPTHLFHFNGETIIKYLTHFNFCNMIIYHQFIDRDLFAPINHYKEFGKKIQLWQKIIMQRVMRKTFVKLFLISFSFLNRTSRMTIYCDNNLIK